MFGGPSCLLLKNVRWPLAMSVREGARRAQPASPREVLGHLKAQEHNLRSERQRVEQADNEDQHTAKRSSEAAADSDAIPPPPKRKVPPLAPLQGQTEPALWATQALDQPAPLHPLPPPRPSPPLGGPLQPALPTLAAPATTSTSGGKALAPQEAAATQAAAMLPPKPSASMPAARPQLGWSHSRGPVLRRP